MNAETKQLIEEKIKDNKVLVFMKGTPDFPQCGSSAAAVEFLQRLGISFATVDVLADMDLRQGIKEYSNWPTIPQIYINGQFIGGCDITRQLYESGQLEQLLRS